MTETTVNVDLLERVMTHIEQNPGQHYQGSWMREAPGCGTQFCFAGWTAILDGVSPPPRYCGEWGVTTAKASVDTRDYDGDDNVVSVARYAQLTLGLDNPQRGALFFGGNSPHDLRRIVDGIKAGQNVHR